MRRFSKLWLLSVSAISLLTSPAFATAELKLSDGNGHTADIVATSCGGNCLTATFNGVLGDWNINVTTGTADPGQSPIIDLNSINHHNASNTPSTLTMEWSADGFTPASPGFELNIGGTIGAHGTLTAALYGGTSDTRFDLSNEIGSTLVFNSPPVNFSGSEDAYYTGGTSPYAITEVATLTFGKSAGQASFDYSVDAIPEPASVVLLGSIGLIAATIARRRVQKRRSEASSI